MSANKTIYLGTDKKRLEGLLEKIGQALRKQGNESVSVKGKISHSAVITTLIEKAAQELLIDNEAQKEG